MSVTNIGIAFCGQRLSSGNEIQLLPAGYFKSIDGRPADAGHWSINAGIAQKLMQQIGSRKNALVIDYEHQTLESMKSGKPAPAAGWFKKLVWREGKGLFAIDVEWTEKAKNFIKAKEYRYISPVMKYDKASGAIIDILNAAITNFPAIDGMNGVSAMNVPAHLLNDATNNAQLTREESDVCRLLGISPSEYLSTKNSLQTVNHASLKSMNPGLSDTDLYVCQKMGLNPEEYIKTKYQNQLR